MDCAGNIEWVGPTPHRQVEAGAGCSAPLPLRAMLAEVRSESFRRETRIRTARWVQGRCCCRVTARRTLRVPQSPIAFVTEVACTTGTAGMEPDGIRADIPVLRRQA
jgi:hypothetical protein